MQGRSGTGTTIGMSRIKERRLTELTLSSHPDLHVGECVPFYFCPRSVMLYVIHRANAEELAYRDGQGAIIHLEADLRQVVTWADAKNRRWAFTTSNAGAFYFEDYNSLEQLSQINWEAVKANQWAGDYKEPKQAEFLIEESFPWDLVQRVGVHSRTIHGRVMAMLGASAHRPPVEIRPEWYY